MQQNTLDPVATPASLVSELATHDCSISVSASCSAVHATLTADPSLPGVAVVDADGRLCGLISRRRFMEVFTQPYRREVYFPRHLHQLIDVAFAKPLCVAANTSISDATAKAVSRNRDQFGEPIALAYESGNFRVLEMQDLLHALAQRYAAQFRELETAKDSLVQAEKLASLGGLVAGVAHEINTPVGVSLTAASFLTDKFEAFAKLLEAQQVRRADLTAILKNSREVSGIILHNMQRTAALVQSFKQVAADQTSEQRRVFDLKESVQQILQSLGPRLKQSRVSLACSTRPRCASLSACANCSSRAFCNVAWCASNFSPAARARFKSGAATINITER
jgi:signal transduction histidine kinase